MTLKVCNSCASGRALFWRKHLCDGIGWCECPNTRRHTNFEFNRLRAQPGVCIHGKTSGHLVWDHYTQRHKMDKEGNLVWCDPVAEQ